MSGITNNLSNKVGKLKITIDSIEALQHDYSGVCLYCNNVRDNVEPDAENYSCDLCGMNGVIGPHWIPYQNDVIIVDHEKQENIKW